jgi:recombination protein RecA
MTKENMVSKEIPKEGLREKEAHLAMKKKLLDDTLSRIDKQYGKGSIMLLGTKTEYDVEVFGPESSGKTTIALQIIAEVQKQNGIAAFVDAEHALDLQYAENLGINVPDLVLSQPDYGEQALDIVEM